MLVFHICKLLTFFIVITSQLSLLISLLRFSCVENMLNAMKTLRRVTVTAFKSLSVSFNIWFIFRLIPVDFLLCTERVPLSWFLGCWETLDCMCVTVTLSCGDSCLRLNCKLYIILSSSTNLCSDLLFLARLLKVWSTDVQRLVQGIDRQTWGILFSDSSSSGIPPLFSEFVDSQLLFLVLQIRKATSFPICPISAVYAWDCNWPQAKRSQRWEMCYYFPSSKWKYTLYQFSCSCLCFCIFWWQVWSEFRILVTGWTALSLFLTYGSGISQRCRQIQSGGSSSGSSPSGILLLSLALTLCQPHFWGSPGQQN